MKGIHHLGGTTLAPGELREVEIATGLSIPPRLALLLTSQPLVGLSFSLDEQADESGLGVEFRWMTAKEMIDEATSAYPGIVAVRCGFLPIGICLEGTGDPYFLCIQDGVLVRIPHDAATEDRLDATRAERIAASIEVLIETAEVRK